MRRGIYAAMTSFVTATMMVALIGPGMASAKQLSVQQTALKEVAPFTVSPPSIGENQKLTKLPPKNEKVAIMSCGDEACNAWANSAAQAAGLFGWKATVLQAGLDPTTVTASFNQVLSQHYTGVLTNGINEATWTAQGAQLAKAKVPVIDGNTALSGPDPTDGIVGVFIGKLWGVNLGKQMAYATAAEAGPKTNALFVGTTAFASVALIQNSYVKSMKTACPSCKVSELEISAADVASGQSVPNAVAYVQAHRQVNLILGIDSLLPGLKNALTTAGLTNVRVAGTGGSNQAYEEIAGGTDLFTFIGPDVETGYTAVDGLARYYEHKPVQAQLNLSPDFLMLDHANISKWPWKTPNDSWPFISGYKSQYRALWGLS